MKPAAYNKTKKSPFALLIVLIAALFAAYLIEIRGYAISDKGVSPEASVIVVNTLSDVMNATDGLCTLREAIWAANINTASGATAGECAAGSSSESDVINIAVVGTINLDTVLPDIVSDMTIIGPGSSQLTIRRNSGTLRILSTRGTVSLSGMTVSNGKPPAVSPPGGGGILNGGTLTLTDVAVRSNETADTDCCARGGGIFNQATLTMTNCVVDGNLTHGGNDGGDGGGGVFSWGTLTMTNCVVNGNRTADSKGTSKYNGGGIYNAGKMTLTNTTISNNSTGNGSAPNSIPAGYGAGIYNAGHNASLSLVNCTVSGNRTGDYGGGRGIGGGILNAAPLIIAGTTISGNDGKDAGGLYNETPAIVVNSTITANQGFGVIDPGNPSSFQNTIVAGNVAGDVSGQCTSLGHNLIGNPGSSTGFTNGANGDQVGTSGSPLNPQLGPLANNGGATQSMRCF